MLVLLLFYWEWLMGAGRKNRKLKISHASLGTTTMKLDFNPDLTISFPG